MGLGVFAADLATLHGRAQSGEHCLVPARGFETARLVVVMLGGGEAGMAEYEAGIADMLGVLDGDRGGGGIAEPMWRQADAEGAIGVYANAPRHGAVLTPQQNGPVALLSCLAPFLSGEKPRGLSWSCAPHDANRDASVTEEATAPAGGWNVLLVT
jgi:hypothetical protein